MKLLLVEDDPLVGPAMKAVLHGAGYDVMGPMRNAAKAMRVAGGDRPDLALVDFNLAGGEDGLSLIRRLHAEQGVPALLVTAFEHRADEARDAVLGVLSKPFKPAALLDAVQAAGAVIGGIRPANPPAALRLFGAPLLRAGNQ